MPVTRNSSVTGTPLFEGVATNRYPLLVPVLRTLSTIQAVADVGAHGVGPPRLAKFVYPIVGYARLYVSSDVEIVRIDADADASFAEILARSRFGNAIAAMIRIIATTIRSSIKENPSCRFIEVRSSHIVCLHFDDRFELALADLS